MTTFAEPAHRSPNMAVESLVKTGNTPSDTVAWLQHVAELGLDITRQRTMVSDLAWLDRQCGNPVVSSEAHLSEVAYGNRTDDLTRLVRYFVTQRHRFDFRFDQIRAEVASWGEFPADAQLSAMHAFAELGLNAPGSMDALESTLRLPDVDQVARDILLHGLWFARRMPGHAERLLELSEAMLARGEVGPNVYFRRAYAFRSLEDFTRARSSVLTAMDLLGPGSNDVHQDYAREHEAITLAESLDDEVKRAMARSLESALQKVEERATRAEESLSRSLVSVVEVLGVFLALVGFVGTSLVAAFQATSVANKLLVVVILLFGSLAFFVLLRVIVSGSFRRSARGRQGS